MSEDGFHIGGETSIVGDASVSEIEDIRVRIGTLLKSETVSFLLGAGVSVDCGGVLIGTVPIKIEKALLEEGISKSGTLSNQNWLSLFYLAARNTGASECPVRREEILKRWETLKSTEPEPLAANFETVLATLYHWRSALPESGGHLRMDGPPQIDARAEDLDQALAHSTRALGEACDLPVEGKEMALVTFKTFARKLLTRPLNLKRVNIFTLNYDTLVEQAADAEGVVLFDGFVGTQRRVFRPESYEQDLYFPAETTEGRVHRFDRVLHLYKLHGSITWKASQPSMDNPYGVEAVPFDSNTDNRLLIYPTPVKYGETLGLPYSELFRRFAAAVVRPQSVLFVIGYGFGDEHVNTIIRQALSVPSFTLVIVDPSPKSEFVNTLRQQNDPRIWIAEGPKLGTFNGFVENLLPDLREEEIRKKVIATHKALTKNPSQPQEGTSNDS